MKVSNYKKEGNIINFTVSGIDHRMLNAFRRTISTGVPCMAVEEVIFTDNSSILNDEGLAHRIGLIPLTTDFETYTPIDECTCDGQGCGRCTCVLGLELQGPETVYSGAMKSQDENVKPVFDSIPLVTLMPKHHVKFEAKAILGKGSDHIKWQPGLCSYEKKDDGSYNVFVESFGSLPVETLVRAAFTQIESKISMLKAIK